MPVSIEELRPHLQAYDFTRLFVEGLGGTTTKTHH